MNDRSTRCVLLADRHHGLMEGVRGLLETAFGTVFMVGDEASLIDGIERLEPSVTVVDLALAGSNWLQLLRTLRERSPGSKLHISVWPVAAACLLACCDGDELQQPICPQCTHRRRWNHQPSSVARHSTQPVPLGGIEASIVISSDMRAG